MTKEDSIKLLQRQIEKLDSSSFDYKVWTSETNSIIDRIFGEKSEPKKNNLRFIKYTIVSLFDPESKADKVRKMNEGKEKARKFLLSYISEIESLGISKVEKVKKGNVLASGLFWAIFVPCVGGAFTLGQKFGETKFDSEKIELYKEKERLSKRLDSLSVEFENLKVNNGTIESK